MDEDMGAPYVNVNADGGKTVTTIPEGGHGFFIMTPIRAPRQIRDPDSNLRIIKSRRSMPNLIVSFSLLFI